MIDPHRYYITPAHKFVQYSTQYSWINFATGGDSAMITAKTATPSNIYLEIAIMYRMRPEYINEIYAKWPTNNIQRDYILFAKVPLLS